MIIIDPFGNNKLSSLCLVTGYQSRLKTKDS